MSLPIPVYVPPLALRNICEFPQLQQPTLSRAKPLYHLSRAISPLTAAGSLAVDMVE